MDCCVVVAKIEHETTKVSHDASYLAELEGLATNRYSAEDSEYMQELNGESPAPPLVAPETRAGGGHRNNRGGRGGDWRQRDHSRDGGDRRQNRDRNRDGGDWRQQGDRSRDGGDWRQQRDHSRDGRSRGGGGGGEYYNRESSRSDGGSYNRHYQQGDDNGHGGYHRSHAGGGRGGDSGQHRDSRDSPYSSSGARGETNSEQDRYRNSDQRSGSNRDQNR